ncbi:MAG: AmmeMemoRadiSam system protein B [Thermoplasmata archaeon]
MSVGTRRPAVAGQFYAGDAPALLQEVDRAFTDPRGPGPPPARPTRPVRTVRAAIVPHAGYPFSGPIAAHAFAEIAKDPPPAVVLVLGVDHHGVGTLAALSARPWHTPLGDLSNDASLRSALSAPPLEVDEPSHALEHSIEVELPFLQRVLPGVPFVPIQVRFASYAALERVARVVARAVEGKDVLLLASTDLSHYEPEALAAEHDARIIDRIVARDARGLYDLVVAEELSMCGIAPTTVLLQALAGEPLRARTLRYGHSGEAARMATVVGYVSVVLETDASPSARPPVK